MTGAGEISQQEDQLGADAAPLFEEDRRPRNLRLRIGCLTGVDHREADTMGVFDQAR